VPEFALNTQSYATLEDLYEAGLPPAAIGSVAYTVQQKALLRASREADAYLRDRYSLPMASPIDQALIQWVVQIASYYLMVRRGFDPSTPGDAVIRMGYEDALKSLRLVANGQLQLAVNQQTPPSLQPVMGTSLPRGYGGITNAEDIPFVGPNSVGL
jgi:phage gp36-like protein